MRDMLRYLTGHTLSMLDTGHEHARQDTLSMRDMLRYLTGHTLSMLDMLDRTRSEHARQDTL